MTTNKGGTLNLKQIEMFRRSKYKNFIIITLPTFLIIFIILELFFRYGLIASDAPKPFINKEDGLVTYDSSYPTGRYTYGSLAQVDAKWTINNMGWNYPFDYLEDTSKPLIAVIGDSYIAALEVNSNKNYPYLLHKKYNGQKNVYAFGLQGAPLSQYLDYTRYAKRHFAPSVFIINLCHNDFDESIEGMYRRSDFFKLVSVNDSTITEIQPKFDSLKLPLDNWFVNVVFKSAVVRYIYRNTHIVKNIKRIFGYGRPADNLRVNEALKNLNIIKFATKNIIQKMITENPDARFLFVIDAPRNGIYVDKLDESNVLWISKMLADLSAELKFDLLDLTYSMEKDYRKNKVKFNFDVDGHWNEYGHNFVANEIFNFLK